MDIRNSNIRQDLELWYDEPAEAWMTEALPIGNGRLGAMIFGGVKNEHLQFNENTLWTGKEVCAYASEDMGAYQAFGDIYISLTHTDPIADSYRRSLDISLAVAQVEYDAGGIQYKRTYFASHPDQVIVMQYTASHQGAYTGEISLTGAHNDVTTAEHNSLTFSNELKNGEQYECCVCVKNDGGNLKAVDNKIVFENCNSLTIFLAADTDYSLDYERHFKGDHPHSRIVNQIDNAYVKPYDTLLESHVADYQSLFNRVSLNLGKSGNDRRQLPTDERLKLYFEKDDDPEFNALYFQFGRYLLISSSRKGFLPANLQGLWNDSLQPMWRCDYHSNINLQMNYWPAEVTNLSECHIPMLDLITNQAKSWHKAIQNDPEFRKDNSTDTIPGWATRTETSPWAGTDWNWNKTGNAWYCQHFWEHYAFTGNKEYLKDIAYPFIKNVVAFWVRMLKELPDGTLVVPMGWSPEHGPTEDGVSYDQEIVWDLFSNYVEAADILGIDKEYRDKIKDMRNRLLTPKIGKWGQLQEWAEDIDDPNDDHRHVSHLFGLHPGKQFSIETTPELAKAAAVSLNARGDGGTGWSRAWKINFWARLQDGDHAYLLLKNLLTPSYGWDSGTYPNLFDAHPPFQIDGNFGATAGIAEMLVQSQTGAIHLLPALPKAWKTGSFAGLQARNGFTIDLEWSEAKIDKVTIVSNAGLELKLLNPFDVCLINRNGKPYEKTSDTIVIISTKKDDSFTFTSA